MGMRITTGMSMNTYRYNLQNSTKNRTDSMNKVLSHRKFDSFAEDPSSAIQAWRVRRSMVNTNSYSKNNTDTLTRFDIAWATMGSVSHDLTDLDGRSSDIYAASDPTAAGRVPLGKVLHETAESVIQSMNGAKSGENYVFAGDDELNAPFTWDETKSILYYRGVNVNAGAVKNPAESFPDWVPKDDKGLPVANKDDAALAQAFKDSLPDAGKTDAETYWISYYKNGGDYPPDMTPPVKETPEWVPMDTKGSPIKINDEPALAQAFKDSLPAQGSAKYEKASALEQAWFDYYKGVSKNKPSDPPANWNNPNDYGVPEQAIKLKDNGSAYERAWAQYYVDQGDVKRLEEFSKEEVAIDLGMGLLEEADGKLVPGTYFNRTLPGINMLGYGVDEDGDPKNCAMILKRLGEIYSGCDENSGAYASDSERDEAMRLLDKLKAGQSFVSGQYVDISAQASFLKQNSERLNLQGGYLNEQRAELEDVDLADAITQFSWDYYCYSAALKVGTQLLSQSLIDYMN